MADHLTDEEQLEKLKNWWKDNGTSLIVAVLVGLIAYFGFHSWQAHQQKQSEEAATLYSQLVEVVGINNQPLADEQVATVSYLAEQLQEGYASSLYAVNASLYLAKVAVETQDLDAAEIALSWAVEHANEQLVGLATLRLGRVYLSQGKHDQALSLINLDENSTLLSANAELKGDILMAKNDTEGAEQAYQQAVSTLSDARSFRGNLLSIKLADIAAEE